MSCVAINGPLDTLRPTSTGLDSVPAWFLRLGATVFIKPLHVIPFQSITCYVYSSTPMEASHHMSSSRNYHTKTMFRFQANICYAHPHTNHGKNRSPKFSLSSVAYFTAQTDSRRPVRTPPHWINHCCSHISCTQLPSFLLIIRMLLSSGLISVKRSTLSVIKHCSRSYSLS